MNKFGGAFLTPSNVRQIKALLWKGEMWQRDIAEHYFISQATVSRIYGGHEWPNVQWPDGTKGAIDEDRRRLHKMLKRKRPLVTAAPQVQAIAAEVERQLGAKTKATDFGSVITGKKGRKTKKG